MRIQYVLILTIQLKSGQQNMTTLRLKRLSIIIILFIRIILPCNNESMVVTSFETLRRFFELVLHILELTLFFKS